MFRVLFLILVLMSSVAFAQIGVNPKLEARKIDEFGPIGTEHFEALLESFIQELKKDITSSALIINYGADRDINRSERTIKNWLTLYKMDDSKITLVRGGFLKERKTQFWIIPEGAEAPQLIPLPYKLEEFGKATNGYVKMLFDSYMVKLQAEPSAQGYVINYGTPKEIRMRERQIRNAIAFRKFDASRITMVNGGETDELKTQFWIVPAGAENPNP